MQLDGEKKLTKPAQLFSLDNERLQVRLVINEGKYHQVKRMFAAVGNRVVGLYRESIGNVVLDAALAVGEYRALTPEEVAGI